MEIIALYNLKGGVGKTSASVNLGFLSALEGARTLIWDLDPQGAASFYLRIRPRVRGGAKGLLKGRKNLGAPIKGTDFEGLDLLPSDFSYRNFDRHLDAAKKPEVLLAKLLQEFEGEYDRIFLDSPPSISRLSESIFVASDVVLVPTVPTPLSLRTLDQLSKHLAKKKRSRLKILPFFSLVDRRKGLHRQVCDSSEGSDPPFLKAAIPYNSIAEQMGIQRQPLAAFAPKSPPALAFEELWAEVKERVRK